MSPPLPLGSRVDGYSLDAILGEGAAGVVYEASPSDGSPGSYALKVLHPHLANDVQVRGRFLRESEILSRLSGPCVCPVLHVGQIEGSGLPYMLMPKLGGTKLSAFAKLSLTVSDAVGIVREICRALDTAHGAGIVHRDLKPDNVMVGARDVTVVDFGMAKVLRGNHDGMSPQLTTAGMIFGTAEYMSPEQARGTAIDERCDVYAAGIILYELLVGEVPFDEPNPLLTLTRIVNEDPAPLAARTPRPDVSPALAACVMHAIARDPEQRYPKAQAFSDALGVALVHPHAVDQVRPDRFFDTSAHAQAQPGGMVATGAQQAPQSAPQPYAPQPVHPTQQALQQQAQPNAQAQQTMLSVPAPSTAGLAEAVTAEPPRVAPSWQPQQAPRPVGHAPAANGATAPLAPMRARGSLVWWGLLWLVLAVLVVAAGVYFALPH